jgi:hypothetical protein
MKKAKEASQEVIALLPLTDAASADSEASRAAAIAAAAVYRQELVENFTTRQDTSRGILGQAALVRELEAAWKGFVHRLSTRAPDLFGSDEFKGSFEALVRPLVHKDVAGTVWNPPVGPKERAAKAKAEADAAEAAKAAAKAARKNKGGKDVRGKDNRGNKPGQNRDNAQRNAGARPGGQDATRKRESTNHHASAKSAVSTS